MPPAPAADDEVEQAEVGAPMAPPAPIILPPLIPTNQADITAWKTRDCTARTLIMATQEPSQKQALYGCHTAREMWLKLQTQHVAQAEDLEHALHQQLQDIKYDPGNIYFAWTFY